MTNTEPLKGKMNIIYDDYTYCSKCEMEVETVDMGFPISGSDFRCPHCDRTNNDMYEDNKGIEWRKRNPMIVIKIPLSELGLDK